jgi:hypothetical protein
MMPELVSREVNVEDLGAMAEDECVQIVSITTDNSYVNSYRFTMCHSKLLRLGSKPVAVLAPMAEDMIAEWQG